ncbi:MAG TPA: AAA family ATPase, partial [Pseudonocardiaceae bacterium]|nr:AAA family ATPase [Pseudonocardiaceae bacterium]
MPSTPLPLVGRDKAQAVLREAITATTGGSGECIVVEGPAGIGKSRLLADAADWAREHGVAVAAGRAIELDRVVPLNTLLTTLRSVEPPILDDAVLAALTRHENSRYRLVDQLGAALESYSSDRPLAVVLDDTQWADELTSLALRIMVPTLRSLPIVWLLARRPAPARTAAADTVDWLVSEGARLVRLEPLADAELAEFCANVLGARPGPSVLNLAVGSGGNPFLLTELLATLRADGRIEIADGTAHATPGSLPVDFVTAVEQRLRDLSPDTLRLLEAGAVLGRPFTLSAAAGLLRRNGVELVDATAEAVSSGTLEDHDTTLAFRHDLLREAVYDRLTGPVKQALHLEAAAVVRAEGGPAAEVVEHFLRGTERADAAALPLFREAVAQVAPTAPGAAADLVLRMINLLDTHDPDRLRLVGDGVRLLAAAGRVAEARELGDTYLTCGLDEASEGTILLGLAEALKHAGQDRLVADYTHRALALGGVPDAVRAELLAVRAHALVQVDDVVGAGVAARSAVELGHVSGAHSAVAVGGAARSIAAYAHGDLDDAVRYARDAVALATSVGGEASHRHPRLWLARALVAIDQFTDADAMYVSDKDEADELGTVWSRPVAHQFHAELKLAAGHVDDAEAEAEAGIRIAEELSAMALSPALLATLANVAVLRDDLSAASAVLERAAQQVGEGICVMTEELSWEVALYQVAAGRPNAAFETLAGLYPQLPDRPYLIVQEPSAAPRLVAIALRVHADAEARNVVEAAGRLADRNPNVVSLAGAAQHAAGLLHRDRNALHAAVAAHRAGPRPLCRAYALEDAGLAERAAGNQSAAVALLDEAKTT